MKPLSNKEIASKNDAKDSKRIAKVIAGAGVCSRRQAEQLIFQGKVKLNGVQVFNPGVHASKTCLIHIDGRPVVQSEKKIQIWRYHKPLGIIVSTRDDKGRPTVFDQLPQSIGRVISIGRLDINSQGLLLLTNDGLLANRLMSPQLGWKRTYRVRVWGRISDHELETLRQGLKLEDEVFRPMEAIITHQENSNTWLQISLREGRKREIRRAIEHFGYKVNRLIRISFGPFELGKLQDNELHEVTRATLKKLLVDIKY